MIHKTWRTYQYRGTFYYWCFQDFNFTGHAGKVRPETWDQGLLGGTRDLKPHKWDPGLQYEPGTPTFQMGSGIRDPWSGTLKNNLLAWKFECCNKSVDGKTKIENNTGELKMKQIKNSLSLNGPAKQNRLLKYCII